MIRRSLRYMFPPRILVANLCMAIASILVFAPSAGSYPARTAGEMPCPDGTWAPTCTPPCEEDEPCWDCTTMGNGICGLTPSENAAELSESLTDNGQELPETL